MRRQGRRWHSGDIEKMKEMNEGKHIMEDGKALEKGVFKEGTLELKNVFVYRCREMNLENLSELEALAGRLRSIGIYLTGPMILHKQIGKEKQFEIWMPMNGMPKAQAELRAEFCDKISYTRCLYSRVILENGNIEKSSVEMEDYLKEKKFVYHDIFYAIIPIPNGKVIDIYIPIMGEQV